MRLIWMLLFACALSGCAMLQDRIGDRSEGCEFGNNPGLELLDSDATDCGNAGGDSLAELRGMQNCAKKALGTNKPLRFAMSKGGIDYFRCYAIVRRSDRTLWYLQWSVDISYEPDDPRRGPSLFPQKCRSVSFPELTRESATFFEPQDCKADVVGYRQANRAQ